MGSPDRGEHSPPRLTKLRGKIADSLAAENVAARTPCTTDTCHSPHPSRAYQAPIPPADPRTVLCDLSFPLDRLFFSMVPRLAPYCRTCKAWARQGAAGGTLRLPHHHPLKGCGGAARHGERRNVGCGKMRVKQNPISRSLADVNKTRHRPPNVGAAIDGSCEPGLAPICESWSVLGRRRTIRSKRPSHQPKARKIRNGSFGQMGASSGELPSGRDVQSITIENEGSVDQVSLHVYQSIYKNITSSTDSLTRSFQDNIQLQYDEIKQLNAMITQACNQYNVKAANSSVTIFYSDETNEKFNSFDKFSLLNMGHAASVQSIVLSYKILIVPHTSERPELYTIRITLVSRVSMQRKLNRDFPIDRLPFLLVKMVNDTIIVNIRYTDYTVAKALMSIITEWERVLPCAANDKIIEIIQRYSHFIPRGARLIITVLSIVIIAYITPAYFNHIGNSIDNNMISFGVYILASSGLIYAFNTFALWIGQYTERRIDRWSALSYLKINKADEKEITNILRGNKSTLIKALFGCVSLIILPFVTKVCASMLVWYLVRK